MFAKKLAIALIGLNAAGWAFNSLLHYFQFYQPKAFGPSIQITVFLLLGSALYFYKNPNTTKWFGDKLDAQSEVSQTISYVASCACTLPTLMFNLYPLLTKLGT